MFFLRLRLCLHSLGYVLVVPGQCVVVSPGPGIPHRAAHVHGVRIDMRTGSEHAESEQDKDKVFRFHDEPP